MAYNIKPFNPDSRPNGGSHEVIDGMLDRGRGGSRSFAVGHDPVAPRVARPEPDLKIFFRPKNGRGRAKRRRNVKIPTVLLSARPYANFSSATFRKIREKFLKCARFSQTCEKRSKHGPAAKRRE